MRYYQFGTNYFLNGASCHESGASCLGASFMWGSDPSILMGPSVGRVVFGVRCPAPSHVTHLSLVGKCGISTEEILSPFSRKCDLIWTSSAR